MALLMCGLDDGDDNDDKQDGYTDGDDDAHLMDGKLISILSDDIAPYEPSCPSTTCSGRL